MTEPSTSGDRPKENLAPDAVAVEGKNTAGDFETAPSGGSDKSSNAFVTVRRRSRALRNSLLAFAGVGVVAAIVVAAIVHDSWGASINSSDASFDIVEGCVGCTPGQLETIRENKAKDNSSAVCESVERIEGFYYSSGGFEELWAETDRLSLRLSTAGLNPESDLFILAKATRDTLLIINSYLTKGPETEAEVEDFQFALDTMDSAFEATLNRCERDGFL